MRGFYKENSDRANLKQNNLYLKITSEFIYRLKFVIHYIKIVIIVPIPHYFQSFISNLLTYKSKPPSN